MEELLQCEDHGCHDQRWSLMSPNHREPVCIACLLQLLQQPQLLLLKKKIILSEFLGLLCQQSSDILCSIQGDFPVQSHIVFILLDLTHAEDQTFVSMAMEACLKLVFQLKSENLVQCVMDRISKESCQKNKLEQSLPVLVLLGRLLNDIPGLAEVLVHRYDGLLRELGNGLLYPEEAVVSALVYIMIFVFREDLQPQLPMKLCHQVHHSLIIHLAKTETRELQINLLGLLQRNLLNENFGTALLELSLEGSTLLTCLKKLLISSSDVLQMSAVQSCSLILTAKGSPMQHGKLLLEADIAEVLFELLNRNDEKQVESVFRCLAMLADMEDFFTRCHSVYGIGSVLRAIDHMSTKKNPASLREGLQLLTIILERQPPSIPLFSSQADVKSCLVTIATELEKSAGQVVQLCIQVFQAFLRISHLGSPVPFGEIGKTLELAGKRTTEIIRHGRTELRRGSSRLTATDRVKDGCSQAIISLLLCLRQALKVVAECGSEPTAHEETYRPPHLTPPSSALNSFVLHILRCCDEFCIPSVMVKWDTMSRTDDILVYFSLLHQLHCVCPEKMLPLKYKLVSAGFFSSACDVKNYFRCSEKHQGILNEVLADFLTSLSLEMAQSPVDTRLLCTSVRNGLEKLQCKLPDVPGHLLDEDSTLSVHYVCLKIVSLSLLNDDICLSAKDVQSIIVSSLYHFHEISEWPPLSVKYLTFLASWCYNATGFELSQHCKPGFQSLLQWLSSNPLISWYFDHPLQFAWSYSNSQLSDVMGPAMLGQWLIRLPSNPSEPPEVVTDGQTTSEIPPTKDSKSNQALLLMFSKMMNNTSFRNSVQTLLLKSSSEKTLEKLAHLITAVIYGTGRESKGIQQWASDCLPQSLQSLFLNKEHINDNCVIALLHILLSIKDTIPTKHWREMKIIFHLINLVAKALPVSSQVREKCLQYISTSLQGSGDQPEKAVSSMLLQRDDFLKQIEMYVEGPKNSALTCVSLGITASLMLASSQTVVPASGIRVNLTEVVRMLQTDRPTVRLEALRFLAVYLSLSCHSKLLVPHPSPSTDRPQDQPLTFRQFRVIWIYCQQSVLQHCDGLRDVAVGCMYYMVRYLFTVDEAQGLKILSQPWNKLMMDSLMEELDVTRLDHRTVQLLNLFLEHLPGHEVVSEHNLNRLHDHLKSDSNNRKDLRHLKALITKVMAKKKSNTMPAVQR